MNFKPSDGGSCDSKLDHCLCIALVKWLEWSLADQEDLGSIPGPYKCLLFPWIQDNFIGPCPCVSKVDRGKNPSHAVYGRPWKYVRGLGQKIFNTAVGIVLKKIFSYSLNPIAINPFIAATAAL